MFAVAHCTRIMCRGIYLIELFLAYVPLVLLWLIGILGLPIGVAMMISDDVMGCVMVFSVLLGTPGVWGVMQLAKC